jgi:CO/xanthine dehydrogenase FAD-binding subunit
VDCSIVAAAARISLADDGQTVAAVRVALGAVAPNPFRPKQAEALLVGNTLSPDVLREAAIAARDAAHPISDVWASADYRRMLVETLVERVVVRAAERALNGGDAR